MPGELDPVVAIAENLRRLRVRRGFSIERLAERSGVGRSTISDVERGRKTPTINVVARLAAALGVPFTTLLDGRIAQVAVLRAPDVRRACTVELDGVTRTPLVPRGLETVPTTPFYALQLPTGAHHAGTVHAPGTIENVLVAEGAVEVETGGERHALSAGDAIVFGGDRPHVYRNASDHPALLYVVLS